MSCNSILTIASWSSWLGPGPRGHNSGGSSKFGDSGREACKRVWHLNSPKTVAWAKLLSLILDLWKHSVDLISTCMSSTLWVLVRELWYSEQQTVFLRRNNFDQVCLSLWSVWIRIFEKSKREIYQISTQTDSLSPLWCSNAMLYHFFFSRSVVVWRISSILW